MTSKEKVRAAYPRAYINGGGDRPTPWMVYASIDEHSKSDPLILGRSGSPAGAWNNAARSIWVSGKVPAGVTRLDGSTFEPHTPMDSEPTK